MGVHLKGFRGDLRGNGCLSKGVLRRLWYSSKGTCRDVGDKIFFCWRCVLVRRFRIDAEGKADLYS